MTGADAQNISFEGGDIFSGMAAAYGDRPLFRTDDGKATHVSALEAFSELAAIRETGRRLVLCMCENELGGLIGYLAFMRAGAIPLMVGAGLAELPLQTLIARYRPAFAWLPERRAAEIKNSSVVLSDMGYCLLALPREGSYPMHDALALLLGTSGSTGSPRFVRLTHGNIASNARSIKAYLGIGPGDLPVTTLPPTYSYGLSVLHSHILAGSTIALTSKTLFDRGFWDFMGAVRATSFAGVPYHYEMLKKLRFGNMALPDLRTMTQAGGRMEKELTEEFAALCSEKGIRFFSMYGQTEATARMAYLPPERVQSKAGSIGDAIPGGEFWLEDEQGGRIADPDTMGQLVYRGQNVSMGYAEGYEDLGRDDEWQGVLHTGDLARRDGDGDYYIVGRLKRFLKLFGNRINLQDVEEQLQAAGYQALCAGRDDQLDVYLVDGKGETGKQVKIRLVSDLKISPKAINVFAIDELPRNDAGKIQYGLLDTLERRALA